MVISKDNPGRIIPLEDSLQAEILSALVEEGAIRPDENDSFTIDVYGGEVYLKGYLPSENNLTRIESIIHSVVGVVEVHNHLQTNNDLQAAIWEVLWKEDAIRSLDLGNISVHVQDGRVHLTGYLARENNWTLIESLVRSVTGVRAVNNDLITDDQLTIQVTQALAKDQRTRSYILPVSASHGWINLGGEVLTHEVEQAAEKVAGGVPGVRGVITLPRVAGESQGIQRRPVQPRIGAIVYGENGDVGVVTQVVIRPDNPLVTHVVVCTREMRIGGQIQTGGRRVLPLDAFSRVKEDHLFLDGSGQTLYNYPAFDPDEYPLAPFTWKAPYPYTAGEVLWQLRQILAAESRPEIVRERKTAAMIEGGPARAIAAVGA